MRTPSSSSSKKVTVKPRKTVIGGGGGQRTDIDRLDSDAFLHMRSLGAVGNIVGQNLRLTEGVHKSGASGARGA